MAKLDKLMEKKHDGKEIDPVHKAAKMSMLKALRDEMSGMMKDDLHGHAMKKVSVASDSPEGLAHGLDKAKEMIGAADHGSEQDSPMEEASEEHEGIGSPDMYDVDGDMEDAAEEGHSEGAHADGAAHDVGLSPEEEAHMHKLIARHQKHSK